VVGPAKRSVSHETLRPIILLGDAELSEEGASTNGRHLRAKRRWGVCDRRQSHWRKIVRATGRFQCVEFWPSVNNH
jgi:hypothetical protein